MRETKAECVNLSNSYVKATNLREDALDMVAETEYKVREINTKEKIAANGKTGDVEKLIKWLEELNESNENFVSVNNACRDFMSKHKKSTAAFGRLLKVVQALEGSSAVRDLDRARPYFNLVMEMYMKIEG